MTHRITNYCEEGCPHCMQNSTVLGEHATLGMIDKMIAFSKLSPLTTTIQITGGEPLTHPEFITILDKYLKAFKGPDGELTLPITIISNGEIFQKPAKDELQRADLKKMKKEVIKRLRNNDHLLMQITTVPKLYPNHKKRYPQIEKGFNKLVKKYGEGLGIIVCNDLPNGIIPVGRAKDNMRSITKHQKEAFRKSTSCFNMYNVLKEMDGKLFKAIDYIKTHSITTFCKPMITEKGRLVFGEYDRCSTVIDLSEISTDNMNKMRDMTVDISQVLGPCSGCINNPEQQAINDTVLGDAFKKPENYIPFAGADQVDLNKTFSFSGVCGDTSKYTKKEEPKKISSADLFRQADKKK